MSDKPEAARRRNPGTVSFEVQILVAGKWATELVLPDRGQAEEEAIRILESGRRPLAVSVVREELDERTGLIVSTTVFRRAREDDRSAGTREDKRLQMKAVVAEIRADRRRTGKTAAGTEGPKAAGNQRTGPKTAPAGTGVRLAWPLLVLAALIVGGLLTLLKLHSLILE